MKIEKVPENKNDKFRRLAEKRTNSIIQKLQLLGNLSNRGIYEYSDSEIKKMFVAIDDALQDAKDKFKTAKKPENKKFRF